MKTVRWRLLLTTAFLYLGLSPIVAALSAQGTISGRVTTEAGLPLPNARVLALGTTAEATTGEDGRYTLRNVRTGTVEVQALRVGYRSLKKTVTVVGGQVTDLNLSLATTLIQLTEIVTTATGQQRKSELGNAVATLGDVNQRVEETSITNVADLLVAKTPGVILLPSPVVGGAPNIRIRGISSISLANTPIWYIDGVRYATSTSATNPVGAANSAGSTPLSLLNNLSPEEIEDIEIVKGPSAATLYGTNAANGVIVVTTKHGRPGQARWNWTGESRTISDRNHYQEQYANFGKKISSAGVLGGLTRCQLAVMQTPKFSAAQGATCVSDSLTTYDYLSDPDATFIHLGRGSLFGLNVSGGTEGVRYFASGDVDNEFGPIQMAQRDINYYQSLGTVVTNSMFHPRQQQKLNFRTNISAAVNPKFDLTANAGFGKTSNIIEPDNSAIIALLYLGQSGFGYKGCPKGTENTGCGLDKPSVDPTGFPLNDANSFAPGSVMQFIYPVDVQRFTGSLQGNWRPLSWMTNDGTVGVDLVDQNVSHVCRINECPNSGATSRVGNVYIQQDNRRNFSAKFGSTGAWQAKPWLNLRTTVGADYTNEERDGTFSQGRGLPVGGSTLQATSTFVQYSATYPTAVKTLGYYAQEQFALRDRLFLTVAAREDQNSAFGTNFQNIIYPKLQASWIISDETFFPKREWLSNLRLRTSYGANGVQPLPTDAFQQFSTTVANLDNKDATTGTDLAGLTASNPGNASLKPERSSELEMGFEADMFDRRIHIDYTHYDKKTTDALIAVPIPSSVGAPVTSLRQNIGSTQNKGHELQINASVLDTRRLSWDVTFSASRNDNKWLDLGIDPATGKQRVIGAGTNLQQRKDYPLYGLWYRNFSYADANGDGVIQRSEVAVDTSLSFQGIPFAKDLISLASGFDLFQKRIRINMLFDHKGGGKLLEGNYFQCSSTPQACRETQDPKSPLELQARAVALKYGTSVNGTTYTTRAGYVVPFDFWKFRELSAVYTIPENVAARAHAGKGSTFMIGVRNIHTWTNFTGVDPEQNYGTSTTSELQQDFNTSPTPSYLTLRLNLHY